MARQARILSPKGLYYIELKGERLFLRPEDKEKFLEIASDCFADGKIYGTFLSDTLIKMVVKTDNISAVMKSLSIKYARYVNNLAQTSGKLFSGRFKSEPLMSEKDAVAAAEKLVADTPERAGAAKHEETVKKITKPKTRPKKEPEPSAKTDKKTGQKGTKSDPIPVQKPDEAVQKPKKNLPSWLL